MTIKGEAVIELRNSLSELDKLSRALEEFGEANHLPFKVIMDINLALDEIFTNIVSYGYRDHDEHLINIHLSLSEKELNIRVEDEGVPFNPLEMPGPDLDLPLEERKTGGLGIHFVRKMVEGLEYERRQEKNVLTLKKKIPTS